MSWFDEQGLDGYQPYEQGGVTGGTAVYTAPPVQSDTPAPAAAPAFNPGAQVGHNGTANGLTREQYRDQWFGKGDVSLGDLQSYVQQYGGTIVNPKNGTVRTPFGEELDMVQGLSDDGRGRAAWGGTGGPSDGPGGGGQVGNGVPLGAIGVGGGSSAGASGSGRGGFSPYQYQDFTPPPAFVAPGMDQVLQDPSYRFRLGEGLRAVQNSAAAKGTLRGINTIKGINDYAQNSASQEYGNVYNRALQNYNTNFGTSLSANQANNQGRLAGFNANTGADLGYGNLALGNKSADNSYSLGLGNLALGNKQADQSFSLGQGNLALGQGNLGLNWANYGLNAQGQNFNQQYSLANLGLNAAGQAGSYGSAYGANGSNLITGAGNATAAGQAGAWAAYGNALGNIGNTATGYGIYQGMRQ